MPRQEMKKSGIGSWLSQLSTREAERVSWDNSRMVDNVRKLNLPMDIDFGTFDDLDQLMLSVPVEFQKSSEFRFIFRCESKTNRNDVRRKLFVSFREGVKFFKQLRSQGFSFWCNIREVKVPDFAGTFIINAQKQKMVIELWPGRHLELDNPGERQDQFEVFSGCYNPGSPSFDLHINWSDNSTVGHRTIAVQAVQYLAPQLKLVESVYVEFYWQHTVGTRFIALSEDPFWTKF